MGMVTEDQQTFEGLVNHLKSAFQLGETVSKLISNFDDHVQRKNKTEDVFAYYLQILVRKIIAHKPSFREEANEQLKHQCAPKLCDQYYAAIAQRTHQTLDHRESFTQFCGHLAMTFVSQTKLGKISSQATSIEVFSSTISDEPHEPKLSKNS